MWQFMYQYQCFYISMCSTITTSVCISTLVSLCVKISRCGSIFMSIAVHVSILVRHVNISTFVNTCVSVRVNDVCTQNCYFRFCTSSQLLNLTFHQLFYLAQQNLISSSSFTCPFILNGFKKYISTGKTSTLIT